MKSKYTQDVEFNSSFGALQTPIHIYTAAILCGYGGVDVNQKFRYLDLACGNGHTLSLLADAYPDSEFVGIDINHKHIANAKETALKAGLSNLNFIQGDIADLDPSQFKPFDFCAVSGVFSWLDDLRQSKLLDFVEAVVKQGGLLYLDYSAQPGMAQSATLYKMIQTLGDQYTGNSAEKLTRSVTLLNEVRNAGSQFFKQNAIANERLSGILANPAEDEAHEVLNLQKQGLWSSDVIGSLKQHTFSYLGNIGLHHNVKSFSSHLSMPDEIDSLPIETQQMLQDVAWNVAQRKDLYIKSNESCSASLLDNLENKAFYVAPNALDEQNLARILSQFPGANLLTRSNIQLLESGKNCSTFAELAKIFTQKGISETAIIGLFSQLLAARLVSIAVTCPVNLAGVETDKTNSVFMASKLNRLILQEDIHLEHARPFVSPVVGSRLLLPIKDRLYLWALVNGSVSSAWEEMGDLTQIFQGPQGQTLDKEAFVNIIEKSLPAFINRAVPELIRLGILSYKKNHHQY